MRVWLPSGSWIFILGSPEMSIPVWRIIFMTMHANGSHVVCSSRASSIISRICLHKQNGNLMTMAYKNWAFFRFRSLLRTVGHKLCWTIFASRVRGRKGTNSDVRSLLLALWNTMKELLKQLQSRSLHNLIELTAWNMKHWYTKDPADDLWINLKYMPFYSGLKDNATVFILYNLQMCIEFSL